MTDPGNHHDSRALRRGALSVVLTLCAIMAVLAFYDTSVADTDLWWHLAYGRHCVEHGTLHVDHGAFTSMALTSPWVYVSWLGDVTLHAVHALAGTAGLRLMQMILYGGIVALAWSALPRRRRDGWPLFLLAVVLVFLVAKPTAVFAKNGMFSATLLALVFAIHAHGRRRGHRTYWLLPPVFLLWANTHGEVALGLVTLGALVGAELLLTWRQGPDAMPAASVRGLMTAAVVSVGMVFCTPEGWHLPAYWVRQAVTGPGMAATDVLRDTIPTMEYLRPDAPQGWPRTVATWLWLGMTVALVLRTLAAVRDRQATGLPMAAAALLLVGASWMVSRIIFLAAISWLFAMAPVLDRLAWPRTPAGRRSVAASLAVLTVAALGTKTLVYYEADWWGSRLDRTRPESAVRFLRAHALPGPIFNDYLTGGALIWDLGADHDVFIDPRFTPYDPDHVAAYVEFHREGAVERLERLRQGYGFRTAIIGHLGTDDMVAAFQADPRWILAYLGPRASIFVDATAAPAALARREIDPFPDRLFDETTDLRQFNNLLTVASRVAPEKTVSIYRALIDQVPDFKVLKHRAVARMDRYFERCAFIAGDGSGSRLSPTQVQQRFAMYYLKGEYELARLVAIGYLAARPDDPAMRYNLACVDARAGDLEDAARSLDRALSSGYEDLDRIVTDPDLARLRETARFAEIMDRHGSHPASDAPGSTARAAH